MAIGVALVVAAVLRASKQTEKVALARSQTFDDEMRVITKKRIVMADHNHTIFLRMWEERCPKGLDKTQPVCADGPPQWILP